MRENFIFKKKYKPKNYKIYRYLYPIHDSIKKDMEMVLIKLRDASYHLSIDDTTVCFDDLRLELDMTVMIVKDILKTKFPSKFYQLFENLNQGDYIKFYDIDSDYLRDCYDKGYGCCCYVDTTIERGYIYIPLSFEFIDVIAIIHELSHFITGDGEEFFAKEYLGEVVSIFSEFIVLDYALEHFSSHPTIFGMIYQRYQEIIETTNFLDEEENYDATFDYFDRFQYAFAFMIASKLYQEYFNYPEQTMDKIMQFGRALGHTHFNRLMKILGIKLKYYDGQLHYQTSTLEDLLSSFEFVMQSINQQYQTVSTNYFKRKVKEYE